MSEPLTPNPWDPLREGNGELVSSKERPPQGLDNGPEELESRPSSWLHSLPNRLTAARIAIVPLILIIFPLDWEGLQIVCAFLFAFAAATDWADGYVARRFKAESKLGAVLDPIADKMLTTAGLLVLASEKHLYVWVAGILLCREIGVSGLRIVAADRGFKIPVSFLGKIKTIVLDVSIFCLMIHAPLFGWPIREIGMVSIWVALLLSLVSGGLYLRRFFLLDEKSQIS